MYDVISVGSSTVDVFANVKSELIKIRTAHHVNELIAYPCGSKILMDNLEFLTGGGGTNTSTCFSRVGLKTAYLGKVGNDSNGQMILDMLKQEKIDFVGVRAKGISGYSIILDSIEGDRTILAYKGVNNELSFKEINLNKLKTRWMYFSSMVERSYAALEELAKWAHKRKIHIAFNPSNYLAEKGHHYLNEILLRTDLLVLNKEEANLVVGKKIGSIPDLILKLMSYGPRMVVITDGKKGAYSISEDIFYTVVPNKIKVVETTGAGDAFASTFLSGIIKGKSIEESMRYGLLNAESVITHRGAKNGLLSHRKLMAKLNKRKPKLIKQKLTK